MKSDLLNRLENLDRLPRTGWLFCNVPLADVEDVAQHSFDVSAITLLLAGDLEREKMELDLGRALSMAIIHDWAEALTGDYPHTALKHLGTGNKREMERRALEEMLRGTPNGKDYLEIWEEYEKGKSTEARLVRSADYLSMLVQAIKYRERGIKSKELDELWRAVNKDLSPYQSTFGPVRALVAELNKKYRGIK
ncbi:MAG: HD domain-containing protein [Candidatus Hadarchaeota archaeon]